MRGASYGAALLVFALIPLEAAAERWTLHGVGTVRSGWSDNISASPQDAPPGIPPRDDAAFSTLAPGLRALVGSPRTIHLLGYTFEFSKTMGAPEVDDSMANRFSWEMLHFTSPTSDLQTAVVLEHGRTGTFVGLGGATGVDALPSGSFDFLNLEANEVWTTRLNRDWTFAQLANLSAFTALTGGVDAGGVDGGTGALIERRWRSTALGARVRAGYSELERPGDSVHQGTWRALATLRRDLGRRFALALEAGAGGIASTDDRVRAVTRPLWSTALSYRSENWVSARATYRRDVRPNLYIGENLDTDEGELSVSWALPILENRSDTNRRPISVAASAGAGYARLFDLRRPGVGDPWLLLSADAGASWNVKENLEVALTYQYAEQSRRERNTSAALTTLLPFSRNLVFMSVSGRFPAEREQTSLPQVRGARVDGSDVKDEKAGLIPDGRKGNR